MHSCDTAPANGRLDWTGLDGCYQTSSFLYLMQPSDLLDTLFHLLLCVDYLTDGVVASTIQECDSSNSSNNWSLGLTSSLALPVTPQAQQAPFPDRDIVWGGMDDHHDLDCDTLLLLQMLSSALSRPINSGRFRSRLGKESALE